MSYEYQPSLIDFLLPDNCTNRPNYPLEYNNVNEWVECQAVRNKYKVLSGIIIVVVLLIIIGGLLHYTGKTTVMWIVIGIGVLLIGAALFSMVTVKNMLN